MTNRKEIAQTLLDIEAVSLSPNDPYEWASGIQSPIYCDNRLIMSDVSARKVVETALVDAVREYFAEVDVVAGTATAGIPHAAFIAQILDLPMVYVRSGNKDHGKQNIIEGRLLPDQKVLMIEDLISTGGSVLDAGKVIENAGNEVIGYLAIFNYLLPDSQRNFGEVTAPLKTLTDYKTLIEVASVDPEIAKARPLLEKWYKDPHHWLDN